MNKYIHLLLAILLWAWCGSTMTMHADPGKLHKIAEGETLYAISQMYQVAPADIVEANPGLTRTNFLPGQTLLIPEARRPFLQVVEETKPAETQPVSTISRMGFNEMYRIQKGDDLQSIANSYGISVEDLLEMNPELRKASKLRKGEFIFIPHRREPTVEQVVEKPIIPSNDELIPEAKSNPIPRIRIAVILPMKETGNRGRKMLEFYQGLLLAVDSVKSQGATVDVYALDAGSTASDMERILRTNPTLQQMHAIFGPLDQEQIPVLTDFCRSHQVRLILPFVTSNADVYTNPYVYMACAPQEDIHSNVAGIIADRYVNSQFVVVDAGADAQDKRAEGFVAALENQLAQQGIAARHLSIDADESAMMAQLNQFRHNIVVPNSASIKSLNLLLANMKSFTDKHPEYQVQLLGYPEWQTYTSTVLNDLYRFDALAYSTFYRNPLDARTANMEGRFTKWFKRSMYASYPRYALTGLDLGYYILHGLHTLGTGFDREQGSLEYEPYQSHFHFERTSLYGGFVNDATILVNYTPLQTIRVIK